MSNIDMRSAKKPALPDCTGPVWRPANWIWELFFVASRPRRDAESERETVRAKHRSEAAWPLRCFRRTTVFGPVNETAIAEMMATGRPLGTVKGLGLARIRELMGEGRPVPGTVAALVELPDPDERQ